MKRLTLTIVAMALAAMVVADPPSWAQGVTDRVPGSFWGLLAWQWICLFGLTIGGLAVCEVVRFVARKIIRLREKVTGKKADLGERSIRRGAGVLGFVLPWYMFLDAVDLSGKVASRVEIMVQALTILGTILLVYGLWDAFCDAITQRASGVANAERLLIPITRKLVRFIILVAGLLLALGVFGVNITGLLAGVGIGGLVVALAAKDSVENVFGSLTILFDMPFALGDWVKIDKYEGIVEQINLRSTRLRTFEDSVITLPNSNLIKAAVENYGARRYRRQRFQIRVSYANNSSNLNRFMDLIRNYLDKMPHAVPERTVVELNDLTEVSVGVLVQCFIEAESFKDEAKQRNDLLLAIFQAQEKSGVVFVGMPIPQLQEKPPRMSKEMEKRIIDHEDII